MSSKNSLGPFAGPWLLSSRDQHRGAVIRTACPKKLFVAECSPSAVADLIAAAPELLAALKDIAGRLYPHNRELDALIAKAEGRS